MNKAIFLDKDGTLVKDIPYNVDLSRIELEDGVKEGLGILTRLGYKLVIASNQPGIAFGYFDEEDLYYGLQHIQHVTEIQFNGFYYCPHHTAGNIKEYAINCNCRKPQPGLFYKAARELGIDLKQSWMIGDILNDVEAGSKAGCKTILIDNGNETEWELHKERVPDFVVHNFLEAVAKIKRNAKHEYRNERRLVRM